MGTSTPYRIAVREEGAMVNAYWTPIDTMDGAELVACVNRAALKSAPELGVAFMTLMQCLSIELAKTRLGARVVGVDVSTAPQHERSGHA